MLSGINVDSGCRSNIPGGSGGSGGGIGRPRAGVVEANDAERENEIKGFRGAVLDIVSPEKDLTG